ncbi:hypothetical protein Tco_0942713, partial [Tanacetum coccineum]
MEAQSFKDLIIQYMDSIEKCIVERSLHDQEIHNSSRDTYSSKIISDKGNIQCLENDYSKTVNNQSSENQSSTSGNESSRSRNECNERSTFGGDTDVRPSYDTEPMVEVDSNVIPDSSDICDNDDQADQNAEDCEDE